MLTILRWQILLYLMYQMSSFSCLYKYYFQSGHKEELTLTSVNNLPPIKIVAFWNLAEQNIETIIFCSGHNLNQKNHHIDVNIHTKFMACLSLYSHAQHSKPCTVVEFPSCMWSGKTINLNLWYYTSF